MKNTKRVVNKEVSIADTKRKKTMLSPTGIYSKMTGLKASALCVFFMLILLTITTPAQAVDNLTGGIAATSETYPDSGDIAESVFIGEVVTFSLTFDVDEGVTYNVQLVDTLPSGMEYVSGSLTSSVSNGNGWTVSPAVSGGGSPGAAVTVNFGSINNTDSDANTESIEVQFQAVVSNITANQDGVTLTNQAVLKAGGSTVSSAVNNTLTIIEPLVELTEIRIKNDDDNTEVTTGDAGDILRYEIYVTNNGNAPAHDMIVTAVLPESYGNLSWCCSSTGSGFSVSKSGSNLFLETALLAPGRTVRFNYKMTVLNTAKHSDSWDTPATLVYTSTPGDQGTGDATPGNAGASDGERTGTDGEGGALNDYADSVTSPTFTVNTPTVAKQVEHPSQTPVAATVFSGGYADSTDDSNTGASEHNANVVDIAIGEEFSMIITVTFQEGTTEDFVLIDLASPSGVTGGRQNRVMELLSAEVIHVGANLSGDGLRSVGYTFSFTDSNGSDGDYDRSQMIGTGSRDVLNTSDNVEDDDDRYIIRVNARMDDEDASGGAADAIAGISNSDGNLLGNRIQLSWDNYTGVINKVADVEVVEPDLTLSASTISGSGLQAGDTAVFELTLNNTGTATAYNVKVTDTLPNNAGSPYTTFSSVTATDSTCDDISGFSTDSGSAPNVAFSLDSLGAGESCTIRFNATVQNTVTANSTYTNSATLTSYDSRDNPSDPDVRNYTGGTDTSTIDTLPKVELSVSTSSGSEAAGTVVTVTATASSTVSGAQTVDVSVSGTGISASDYSLSKSTITIANGSSAGSITFTIQDDSEVEGDETATLTILNPSGGLILGSTTSQNVSITDNDFLTVSSITRVDSNPTNAASVDFTVTFSENVTGVDISDFSLTTPGVSGASVASVSSGTCSPSCTVRVNTGTGDGTIRLDVTDDNTILTALNSVPLGGSVVGDGNFTGGESYTIDKSAPVFISVDDGGGDNVNKGGETISFDIDLGETGLSVTADLSVLDSAFSSSQAFTDDGDGTYSYTTSALTIGTMQVGSSINVTFTASDDAGNSSTDASLSLFLYETTPTIRFTSTSQNAGEDSGSVTITAELSSVSGLDVSLPFSVNVGSTAANGTDYSLSASPLTITADSLTADITVTIDDDSFDESDETVIVEMGTPGNATQGANTTHMLTIQDNDTARLIYDEHGGTWHDANKNGPDDDDMCWAAAASNLLAWGGWDAGFGGSQAIFDVFENHWQNLGGNMFEGWKWWADGTAPGRRSAGAKVDVGGAGGYYMGAFSDSVFVQNMLGAAGLLGDTLQAAFDGAFGVSLGLLHDTDAGQNHALTVWGYQIDTNTGELIGLHVTDSDDGVDQLAYVDVEYNGTTNAWELLGGYSDWYINELNALSLLGGTTNTTAFGGSGTITGQRYGDGGFKNIVHEPVSEPAPVPEPASLLLLGVGVFALFSIIRVRRRQ